MDLAELQRRVQAGAKPRFVFFWSHQAPRRTPGKEVFSQWYPAPFEVDGVRYATAEHWMMAGKARLFEDDAMLERILDSPTPAAAKALGREVGSFHHRTWEIHRQRIVLEGNLAKFKAHSDLCQVLVSTGEKVLAEASPGDRIWGIGLAEDDPAATSPLLWPGQNLLGFTLMEVRRHLR